MWRSAFALKLYSVLKLALCGAIFSACSLNDRDHAGVTSTGNAGEIVGVVVKPSSGQSLLLRTLMAAQMDEGLGIAAEVVYRYNSDMRFQDSALTDIFGIFRFTDVKPGLWVLQAIIAGDTVRLGNIQVQADQLSRARLQSGGGSSVIQETNWVPPGLHSTQSRIDTIESRMTYTISTNRLLVTRSPRSVCGQSYGTPISSLWQFQISNMILSIHNPQQLSCPTLTFFSTVPNQLENNAWFLNGDLRAMRDSLPATCTEPLAGVPELVQTGMETVTLHLNGGELRVVLSALNWCLLRDARGVLSTPSGTATMLDCTTMQVELEDRTQNYQIQYKAIDFYDPWSFRIKSTDQDKCSEKTGEYQAFSNCDWKAWPKDCE